MLHRHPISVIDGFHVMVELTHGHLPVPTTRIYFRCCSSDIFEWMSEEDVRTEVDVLLILWVVMMTRT